MPVVWQPDTWESNERERLAQRKRTWWGLLVGSLLLFAALGLVLGLVVGVSAGILVPVVLLAAAVTVGLFYLHSTERYIKDRLERAEFNSDILEACWNNMKNRVEVSDNDYDQSVRDEDSFVLEAEAVAWRLESLCDKAGWSEFVIELRKKRLLVALAYQISSGGREALNAITGAFISLSSQGLEGGEMHQRLCDILGLCTQRHSNRQDKEVPDGLKFFVKPKYQQHHQSSQSGQSGSDYRDSDASEGEEGLLIEECYQRLGLESDNADLSAVKKAFRKLALRHHPDKGGNAAKFRAIYEAYERLSRELQSQRERYYSGEQDMQGSSSRPAERASFGTTTHSYGRQRSRVPASAAGDHGGALLSKQQMVIR